MKELKFIITTFLCSLSLLVYAGKECSYGYITCKNGKVVRIKSIITENDKLENFNFEYNDKGQLCKVLSDSEPWYISYNPLTLQWGAPNVGEDWEVWSWESVETTSLGFLSKIREDWMDCSGDEVVRQYSFEYNDMDNLTLWTEICDGEKTVHKYEWKNGDVLTMDHYIENCEEDKRHYVFSYEDSYNNIYQQFSFNTFLFDADYSFAFVAGLLGKGSRHLPSRIVYTNDDSFYTKVSDYHFRYTFNDDGTLAISEYSLNGAPYVKTQYCYEEVEKTNQIEIIRNDELKQKYDVFDFDGRNAKLGKGMKILRSKDGVVKKFLVQ
jgi:hypothetical protein